MTRIQRETHPPPQGDHKGSPLHGRPCGRFNCRAIPWTLLANAIEERFAAPCLPLAQECRNINHIPWRRIATPARQIKRLRVHAPDWTLWTGICCRSRRWLGLRVVRGHLCVPNLCFDHVFRIAFQVITKAVLHISASKRLSYWLLHGRDWRRRLCYGPGRAPGVLRC